MADRRPRLLDLFCGAGGATRGYQMAGFEVRDEMAEAIPPAYAECVGRQILAALERAA